MSAQTRHTSGRDSQLMRHIAGRGIPVVVLVLVLVGALFLLRYDGSAPGHEAAADQQAPVPVSVMTVKRETVPIRMRFLGQTEASKRVEIRARVAGYLHAWTFKEGDRVEQGQALFQIDSRPFEVALAEARARLGSAEATLGLARYQVRRLEDLFSKQAASDVELEEWQVQERVALAQVELAKAQVAAAELELGYATIEAPISGMIGRVLKDTGSYVDSGANGLLAVVQQVDPIYVRYSVTEQEILRFRRQIAASQVTVPEIEKIELELTLADGSIYPHRGHINFVDVQFDEATGTSVVRGQVPNPDNNLRPGQFVHASVLGIERTNVVRVPQGAVRQSPGGASVLVVNRENVAESRPVVLGDWSGTDCWIVERGLEPGDRVITDRLMVVRPGMEVAVAAEVHSFGESDSSAETQPGEASGALPAASTAAGREK